MIETNSLGSAAGIQRNPVIDRSEGTQLPRLGNGVIVGNFKRGRVGKVFTVNSSNYRAILGNEPSNPSYLAIEDAFMRGASKVEVLRVGDSGRLQGSDTGTSCACINATLLPTSKVNPVGAVTARYRVNGGAWQDYTDANIEGDAVYKFLFSLSIGADDKLFIGSGGDKTIKACAIGNWVGS